jgi:hypothetical protein
MKNKSGKTAASAEKIFQDFVPLISFTTTKGLRTTGSRDSSSLQGSHTLRDLQGSHTLRDQQGSHTLRDL